MSEIFIKTVFKFQKLKIQEKKFVLCSFIGLIDRESLYSLKQTLEPFNLSKFQNQFGTIDLGNKNEDEDEIPNLQLISEKLVNEILSSSVRIVENEFLSSNSLEKFILNTNNSKLIDSFALPPIEHKHAVKLDRNLRGQSQRSKKQLKGFPDTIKLLIKNLATEFSTKIDKYKILIEILCAENWDIQFHVYQCVKSRLLDRWSMDSIPTKILENIFYYFSPDELIKASLVNKQWLSVALNNGLWENHCATLGKSLGFTKFVEMMEENIADSARINWFEIYKAIRKLSRQNNSVIDVKNNIRKSKITFYEAAKSVKIKSKVSKFLSNRSTSVNSSRRASKTSIKFNNVLDPDPENDTRLLMKPIIGQLKQFQNSEEIAIDFKSSNLVSLVDSKKRSESKFNLKWLDSNFETHKSAAAGETLQIRKVLTIENCYKLTGHLDGVTMVKFDKSRMFSSSLDGSLRIWDSISGRSIRKLYGHKGAVYCLDFSSQILVSGGWDMSIFVWSLEQNFSLIKILYGHMGSITSLKLLKTKEKLISASLDGTLRIHSMKGFKLDNLVTIKSVNSEPTGIIDMRIEETRNLIATGLCDKTIRLIDMDRLDCIYNIGYQKDVIKCLYFQSHLLISGGHSGFLQFWNTNPSVFHEASMAEIQVFTDKKLPLSIESLFYHMRSLWTAHNDGSIKEWYLASMTCIRTLYGHKGSIAYLHFFDDMMGSSSLDGSIRIWRLKKSHSRETHDEKPQVYKEKIPISCIFK